MGLRVQDLRLAFRVQGFVLKVCNAGGGVNPQL